jgi:hypothetical protein
MRAQFIIETIGFQRGADPKTSMGIGIAAKRNFDSSDEAVQWAYMLPYVWSEGDIPKWDPDEKIDITHAGGAQYVGVKRIRANRLKYIKWFKDNINILSFDTYNPVGIKESMEIIDELQKLVIKKSREGTLGLNESVNFQRGRDTKTAIGIGMEEKLKNYMSTANPLAFLAFRDPRRKYWLQICAQGGRNDLVKYLLSKGVDPNINDGAPLYLAASEGHFEIVKTLIDAGADPNLMHPLLSALLNRHYEIAEYLIERGAKYYRSWDTHIDQEALEHPLIRSEWERAKRNE